MELLKRNWLRLVLCWAAFVAGSLPAAHQHPVKPLGHRMADMLIELHNNYILLGPDEAESPRPQIRRMVKEAYGEEKVEEVGYDHRLRLR